MPDTSPLDALLSAANQILECKDPNDADPDWGKHLPELRAAARRTNAIGYATVPELLRMVDEVFKWSGALVLRFNRWRFLRNNNRDNALKRLISLEGPCDKLHKAVYELGGVVEAMRRGATKPDEFTDTDHNGHGQSPRRRRQNGPYDTFIDQVGRCVSRWGKGQVQFGGQEQAWKMFLCLAGADGEVVTREDIWRAMYEGKYRFTGEDKNTLYNQVSQLNKLLAPLRLGAKPLPKVGYMLIDLDRPPSEMRHRSRKASPEKSNR
jgi:DNA-binding winged helix-turn-helix (wHTH) protein